MQSKQKKLQQRRRMQNRRHNITNVIETEADKYYVSFGIDPNTLEIGEVFIRGSKIGSDMDMLLDDATVVLSLALQYGVPLEQLVHSLHRGRKGGGESILAKTISLMKT